MYVIAHLIKPYIASSLQMVHIDMAPNFAGTLMGITNCFANLISIVAPLAAGAILKDEVNIFVFTSSFMSINI